MIIHEKCEARSPSETSISGSAVQSMIMIINHVQDNVQYVEIRCATGDLLSRNMYTALGLTEHRWVPCFKSETTEN